MNSTLMGIAHLAAHEQPALRVEPPNVDEHGRVRTSALRDPRAVHLQTRRVYDLIGWRRRFKRKRRLDLADHLGIARLAESEDTQSGESALWVS